MEKIDPRAVNPALSAFYKQHPPDSFGFYEEARTSAVKTHRKLHSVVFYRIPLPLDEVDEKEPPFGSRHRHQVEASYCLEKGEWLKSCVNTIIAAVERGDEQFFLNLANLIRNRPRFRGRWLYRHSQDAEKITDPLPKRRTDEFRIAMALSWTEWPLWLMPDAVAASYLRKFAGLEITEANYTKLRQELRLFQHPKHPISAFTTSGMPILRQGWRNAKS